MWSRFARSDFWWMHAMLLVWGIFVVILFVAEPLILRRRMATSATPEADFHLLEVVHRIILGLSIIATTGAVGESHGMC